VLLGSCLPFDNIICFPIKLIKEIFISMKKGVDWSLPVRDSDNYGEGVPIANRYFVDPKGTQLFRRWMLLQKSVHDY
jgi:hypothetical protein